MKHIILVNQSGFMIRLQKKTFGWPKIKEIKNFYSIATVAKCFFLVLIIMVNYSSKK